MQRHRASSLLVLLTVGHGTSLQLLAQRARRCLLSCRALRCGILVSSSPWDGAPPSIVALLAGIHLASLPHVAPSGAAPAPPARPRQGLCQRAPWCGFKSLLLSRCTLGRCVTFPLLSFDEPSGAALLVSLLSRCALWRCITPSLSWRALWRCVISLLSLAFRSFWLGVFSFPLSLVALPGAASSHLPSLSARSLALLQVAPFSLIMPSDAASLLLSSLLTRPLALRHLPSPRSARFRVRRHLSSLWMRSLTWHHSPLSRRGATSPRLLLNTLSDAASPPLPRRTLRRNVTSPPSQRALWSDITPSSSSRSPARRHLASFSARSPAWRHPLSLPARSLHSVPPVGSVLGLGKA